MFGLSYGVPEFIFYTLIFMMFASPLTFVVLTYVIGTHRQRPGEDRFVVILMAMFFLAVFSMPYIDYLIRYFAHGK